jgi:hypothetical protein
MGEQALTRHTPRFRALTGALIGIAVAGVIVAVSLATRDDGGPGSSIAWSAWKPSDHSLTGGARQIANHIAPTYHLPGGSQLAAVTGGKLQVANLPVHIALRASATSQSVSVVPGSAVMFTLCGLGPRCSIRTGTASPQRLLLLRREGLELALYAFHYLNGLENVVALLPPAPAATTTTITRTPGVARPAKTTTTTNPPGLALLFQRQELAPLLAHPLREILPAHIPSVATIAQSPESTLVTKATNPSLFKVSIVQGQDASAFLVLDPPTS